MSRWMGGWIDGRVGEGRKEECVGGWMDGWLDGSMDGWIDRSISRMKDGCNVALT